MIEQRILKLALSMKRIVRNSMFLFSFIIILSGCGIQEKQAVQKSTNRDNVVTDDENKTNLENLFGGEKPKEVLDASEINGYDGNNEMKELISGIFSPKGEYARQYKDMCEEIEFEAEYNGLLEKEEGCYYISDIPIFCWDAIENRIYEHYAQLAVFSEKHEILGTLDLNNDLDGELLFSFMAGDDTFFKEMEEAPKDKYLFILNQSRMLLLNENNEILPSMYNYNPKVTVQGDYYHALPYQTLAISYSDLADEKHLMKQIRKQTVGEEYHLQVLKDESFVDVPLSPEIGFNLLSRNILSGHEYSYKVDIEHNHGDLEAGRYRIVKEYTNKEKGSRKKENTSKETVSAEFDLS